jgi:putative transposase
MALTLQLKPEINIKATKDAESYWSERAAKLSSALWLPASKSQQESYSIHHHGWMSTLKPLAAPVSFDVSLPAASLDIKNNQSATIKATKKIRFYPESELKYIQALMLYRRAYNLAISRYIEGSHEDDDGKFYDLRPWVKATCQLEQKEKSHIYNSLICDNAVREAKTTFFAMAKKNKGKHPEQPGFARLHFKSRKGDIHSFRMCRMPAGLSPAVRALDEIHLTETVPQEAIDQAITVTFDKGRWFINVQQHITTKAETQGKVRCVSVDPGVRTFATCYSPSEVVVAGDKLAKKRLFPLMRKVDVLLSQRQRIYNQFAKDIKFDELPQWARDRLRYIQKRSQTLKTKKEDIVRDLHQRLAHYLTENYDVIFLPYFETKSMVRRKAGRVIRRNTCRQMLDLGHYHFKLMLKWMAKKKGKRVVDANESHTSKTLSHSGEVVNNLGGREFINDGEMRIHRDINGARGIFIKTILQVT